MLIVNPVMIFNLVTSGITMETRLQISALSTKLFLDCVEDRRPHHLMGEGVITEWKEESALSANFFAVCSLTVDAVWPTIACPCP